MRLFCITSLPSLFATLRTPTVLDIASNGSSLFLLVIGSQNALNFAGYVAIQTADAAQHNECGYKVVSSYDRNITPKRSSVVNLPISLYKIEMNYLAFAYDVQFMTDMAFQPTSQKVNQKENHIFLITCIRDNINVANLHNTSYDQDPSLVPFLLFESSRSSVRAFGYLIGLPDHRS